MHILMQTLHLSSPILCCGHACLKCSIYYYSPWDTQSYTRFVGRKVRDLKGVTVWSLVTPHWHGVLVLTGTYAKEQRDSRKAAVTSQVENKSLKLAKCVQRLTVEQLWRAVQWQCEKWSTTGSNPELSLFLNTLTDVTWNTVAITEKMPWDNG